MVATSALQTPSTTSEFESESTGQLNKILFIGSSHLDCLHESWDLFGYPDLYEADFISCSELAWRAVGSNFSSDHGVIHNNGMPIRDFYSKYCHMEDGLEPLGTVRNISFEPKNYNSIVLMDGSFWRGGYQHFIGSSSYTVKIDGIPISDNLSLDLDIIGLGRFPSGSIPLPYRNVGFDEIRVAEGYSSGFDIRPLIKLIRSLSPQSIIYAQQIHMPFAENQPYNVVDLHVQKAIDIYDRIANKFCDDLSVILLTIDETLIDQNTRHTDVRYSRGMQNNGQWDMHLNHDFYKEQIPHMMKSIDRDT